MRANASSARRTGVQGEEYGRIRLKIADLIGMFRRDRNVRFRARRQATRRDASLLAQ